MKKIISITFWATLFFWSNLNYMVAQVGVKLHLESNNNADYPLWITTNNGLIRTNNWGQLHLQNTTGSTTNFWHIGHRDNNKFDIAFGPEMNNIIPKGNAKLTILPSGFVGIGKTNPLERLHVGGNALIQGNLTLNGTLSGAQIDVSQITGLLGQANSDVFPVILDNTVDLEITGINGSDPSGLTSVLIYSSVGFETERISIPTMGGNYTEEVGPTMEFPIEFETNDTVFINNLKSWFDDPNQFARVAQIIIRQLNENVTGTWTFFEYLPDGYQPGNDGRTRFKMVHSEPPNSTLKATYDADFGNSLSFNPLTDKRVEISGGGVNLGDPCTPMVEINETDRTVTLTFDFNEGYQILDWIESTVAGNQPSPSSLSVIETTNGTDEISRVDYFEVRPIKYEHIYGFGLNTKLKARAVLAYGFSIVPP